MNEPARLSGKTCFELIHLGDELAREVATTNPVPEDFVISRYPLDVARIKESCTNYNQLKDKLEELRLAGMLQCICGSECKNNILAHEILDEAARRLARSMYAEFVKKG